MCPHSHELPTVDISLNNRTTAGNIGRPFLPTYTFWGNDYFGTALMATRQMMIVIGASRGKTTFGQKRYGEVCQFCIRGLLAAFGNAAR